MIYLNDRPINITIFPDHTSQVWHLPEDDLEGHHTVRWEFEKESELMHLAQLKLLLDGPCDLVLPYLPYARQDKDVHNDACFALHAFALLLNAMEFESVTVMDPHSDEARKLIHRCFDEYPVEQVLKAMKATGSEWICYPDQGAYKKYDGIYNKNSVRCEKKRDAATGKILSLTLFDGELIRGKTVMIVDDICERGTTFELVAKELKKAGAAHVHLFVTHRLGEWGLANMAAAGIERFFGINKEIR